MNTKQKAILKETVEWVEWQDTLEPGARAWDQGDWIILREEESACGTSYCAAGFIGQRLEPGFKTQSVAVINGRTMHVAEYAELALGVHVAGSAHIPLTEGQIADPEAWLDEEEENDHPFDYDLFDADNTAADIRRIAEYLAGEPL